ncbi:hypothetical protein ACFL96_09345 [Thermoproteota archaeon]
MNTKQKIITYIALGVILLGSYMAARAEDWKLKPGYNAVQETLMDTGDQRFRAYNNAALEMPNGIELKLKTMNQSQPGYFGGWETASLHKKDFPIDPLYVTRVGGLNLKDARQVSQGFGVRVDLGQYLPDTMYGFLDGVAWTESKEEWLGKGEVMLFVGKEHKGWNLDGLCIYRPEGANFGEIEIFSPEYPIGAGSLRPMVRVEMPDLKPQDSTLLVGMQFTF